MGLTHYRTKRDFKTMGEPTTRVRRRSASGDELAVAAIKEYLQNAASPAKAARATGRGRHKPALAAGDGGMAAGIALSHADKQLFPEARLTKLDLALYYEAVVDRMLPLIEHRPLSLFRCPDGWIKQCFFQKHADRGVHESVSRIQVPEGRGSATYFSADSLQALVALVQWGVIELHPWGSRMPHPERPDVLIFDFDPADNVSWAHLVDAVRMMRRLLDTLGLSSFLNTTGGKGLHVVVPIRPSVSWDQAKSFTRAIAELFARAFPDRFTATVSKAKRTGRIFIDYLRNSAGATAIAPYGIRARRNAPVAMPISWFELRRDLRFDHFTVKNTPQRLRRQHRDPWSEYAKTRQRLTREMLEKVGSSALMSAV